MKIFLFLSLTFCFVNSSNLLAQKFTLQLEEMLIIGEADRDSSEYLFSGIRTIRALPNGDILIAGTSDKSIRIFNKKGKFKQKLGRRGRGPGEFLEVTSIEVDSENNIIALDRYQNRVSFFDREEGFINANTLDLKTMGTSQVFKNPISDEFIVVSRDFLNPKDQGYLLHRYDESFSTSNEKHLNVFEYFFESSNSLHTAISQSPRYKGIIFGNKNIAIVPGVYTGTVFVLNTDSYEEKLYGTRIDPIAIEYNFNERERYRNTGEVGFASMSGPSGRYFFKQTGYNIGLVGNNNFLLNFYVLFEGKEIIPFVTIYSVKGQKLANVNLKDSPINFIKNNRVSISVHFLDENNKLYLSDYSYKNSHPAVRVLETNLGELLSIFN